MANGRTMRLALALFASGMIGAFCFALVYVGPMQYLTLLTVAAPIVAVVALLLGGGMFALLRALRVRLTLPICIAVGILLGAIPGVILWMTSQSPSMEWSATKQLGEAAWQPIIFGLFGGVGGAAFAYLSRLLRL